MNDETRKELKAWLEFYQELGIEGFYRRDRGRWQHRQVLRLPGPRRRQHATAETSSGARAVPGHDSCAPERCARQSRAPSAGRHSTARSLLQSV